MGSSFRFWLISSFGVLLLICLTACWVFIRALNEAAKYEDYHSRLKTTRILLFEINKLKEDILVAAINETGFYTGHASVTDKKYWALNKKTNQYIRFFDNSPITRSNHFNDRITQIKQKLEEYNLAYRELIYLYRLKGFKDFGLEGKMRHFAHAVYDFDNQEVKLYCLMLRRHEKDFLLRKDLSYVRQFDQVCKQLINAILKNASISMKEKNFLINQLYFYNKNFKLLARIEIRIGVKGSNGYLEKSKVIFNDIASQIEELDATLKKASDERHQKTKKDTFLIVFIFVLFILAAIVLLTQVISNSVKSISNSFGNYVNSGFSYDAITYQKSIIREFNNINISFLKMAKEINLFTNFFKEKVHERTLAINQQKEEIEAQQAEIKNQYNILLVKNSELSEQKQLLTRKNNDIRDSLRYAKRIQKAILPAIPKFRSFFKDSFVFYKPRDVVSGDFYLVYEGSPVNPDSTGKILFAAADCTGHGVPGAMMSVLGINTIHKLIQEQQTSDPGLILRMLDKDFNRILVHGKEEREIVADGMEIAVFALNTNNYLLEYCIAKLSHYLVRDGEVLNLNSYKSSIGYSFFEKETKNFQTRQFQLKPGDCLYLFSDGYGDQFGGPLNKKFKKSNLKTVIEKIWHLDMKTQKEVIKSEFMAWKKSQKQIDDVMVLGIRF